MPNWCGNIFFQQVIYTHNKCILSVTKIYDHCRCFILCNLLENTQLAIAYSKSTMVTQEKGAKFVQSQQWTYQLYIHSHYSCTSIRRGQFYPIYSMYSTRAIWNDWYDIMMRKMWRKRKWYEICEINLM